MRIMALVSVMAVNLQRSDREGARLLPLKS